MQGSPACNVCPKDTMAPRSEGMTVSKGWIILAAIAAFCLTELVRAADEDVAVRDDSIKTVKEKRIDGKIRQISPTEITIEQLIGNEKIPVNEIESITFGGIQRP